MSATDTYRPIVYTRDTWVAEGAWTEREFVRPVDVVSRLSPGSGPSATFDYFYGDIQDGDKLAYEQKTPADLTGKFVRIYDTESAAPVWFGILTGETDIPGQEDVTNPIGGQMLTARGLEWVLAHAAITGSYIEDGASASLVSRRLPFNVRTRSGLSAIGNRSDAKVASPSGVSSYVFSADGAEWTARDIAEYYLAWFAPAAFEFDLSGMEDNLAVFAGYVPAARNVAEGLNSVIDRRRGHAWRVTVHPTTEACHVEVCTTFASAITVGAKTINPTTSVQSIDPADYPGLNNIEITETDDVKYDKIVVRGAPIVLMGTFSFDAATLVKGWTAANETAYEAATEDARKSEVYQNVFRTFKIPAASIPGGPTCNDDGTLNTGTTAEVLPFGKSFLRQLPVALTSDDADAPAGYKKPLIAIDLDPGGSGKWLPVDKLSQHEVPAPPMSVKVADGETAFTVGANPNYLLGKNHYTPGATFLYQSVADYEDIHATFAWRSDEIFRVTEDTGAGGYAGELHIDIPEAECWYRLANTMTDAAGTKTVTAAAGELRRDVGVLSAVAAMAAGWYGRTRAAVVLTNDDKTMFDLEPGTLIDTIDYTSAKTVNTIVSEVRWDFANQTTTIKTDFKELDFAAIGRAMIGGNRGARLAEAPGLPVRDAEGGGGGHRILSGMHTDADPADAVQGDMIVAANNGGDVEWSSLTKGDAGAVLYSDGTDIAWSDGEDTEYMVLQINGDGNPEFDWVRAHG